MTGSGGYEVGETALTQTAAGLGGVIHELQSMGQEAAADVGRGFTHLKLTGMQVGHDGLTSALDGFCNRWEWGVRALVQDADQIAERLGLAAGTYYEMDRYAERTLKVVVASAIGNPALPEEQEEVLSWSRIGPDNPVEDFLHPDFSTASARQSLSDMGQTWQDTAHDMGRNLVSEAAATLSGTDEQYNRWLGGAPAGADGGSARPQGGG
ncbi:hypothetical protein [Streptomyces sp. NRRL F-5123]|uniref:hypothetical protein n=1 Tax=Streptomyces sp. NRRL F-5123 TaxID=1463856 RepID=UPI000694D1A0|nr:hypothetical protein [Streptomyces sp. NRRL F-5123]